MPVVECTRRLLYTFFMVVEWDFSFFCWYTECFKKSDIFKLACMGTYCKIFLLILSWVTRRSSGDFVQTKFLVLPAKNGTYFLSFPREHFSGFAKVGLPETMCPQTRHSWDKILEGYRLAFRVKKWSWRCFSAFLRAIQTFKLEK